MKILHFLYIFLKKSILYYLRALHQRRPYLFFPFVSRSFFAINVIFLFIITPHFKIISVRPHFLSPSRIIYSRRLAQSANFLFARPTVFYLEDREEEVFFVSCVLFECQKAAVFIILIVLYICELLKGRWNVGRVVIHKMKVGMLLKIVFAGKCR